jgi:uncharacterized iron-regulated membrane protein
LRVKASVIKLHRRLSLAAVIFWIVQALTGLLIVFHWELEDATVSGAHRPTDWAAITRRVAQVEAAGPGRHVASIWTSAGAPDRYDLSVDEPHSAGESIRIDGAGDILRDRPADALIGQGAIFNTLVVIHQTLLSGDTGGWIVGISGVLLLTNLVLGLTNAWPKRGLWRRTLKPPRAPPSPARTYGWHRSLGLWGVIPALLLVSSGISMAFEDGLRDLLHGEDPALASEPKADSRPLLPLDRAVAKALAPYPGGRIAGISTPSADKPVYKIRLLQPGEPRRAYGTTTLFIDARDGRTLDVSDAFTAPIGRRFVDFLYALHTGEAAGLPGRLIVLATASWILTMITLGLRLWWLRRPARKDATERKRRGMNDTGRQRWPDAAPD